MTPASDFDHGCAVVANGPAPPTGTESIRTEASQANGWHRQQAGSVCRRWRLEHGKSSSVGGTGNGQNRVSRSPTILCAILSQTGPCLRTRMEATANFWTDNGRRVLSWFNDDVFRRLFINAGTGLTSSGI